MVRVVSQCILGALLALMLVVSQPARATLTDQSQLGIMENTSETFAVGFTCMEYKITGICFWVRWTMFGPKFSSSFMVNHYVPDTYVDVHHNPLSPASDETMTGLARAITEPLSGVLSGVMLGGSGVGQHGAGEDSVNNSLSYNESLVIGNPGNILFSAIYGSILRSIGYCQPPTSPFMPYQASTTSMMAWRVGMSPVETVAAAKLLFPMGRPMRAVGDNGMTHYGPVLARSGWVNQPSHFKTGAIVANRAVSVTADWLIPGVAAGHWAIPLSPVALGAYSYIYPQTEHFLKFQMQYPRSHMAAMCTRFRISEVDVSEAQYNLANQRRAWSYVVWRPMHCCRKRGTLIGLVGR